MGKAPRSSKSGKVAKSYVSKTGTSGKALRAAASGKSSKTTSTSAVTGRRETLSKPKQRVRGRLDVREIEDIGDNTLNFA